jgi:hypothetical protein
VSERKDIPPADPNAGFKVRADRAIDELERCVALFPLTETQLIRLRLITGEATE